MRRQRDQPDAQLWESACCAPVEADGYLGGLIEESFPGPLYLFPCGERGILLVALASYSERDATGTGIFFPWTRQAGTFPTFSGDTPEAVLAQAFEYYPLAPELTRSEQPLRVQQGVYRSARYLRVETQQGILYLFPPDSDRQESGVLLVDAPTGMAGAPARTSFVRLRQRSSLSQVEEIEGEDLGTLFARLLWRLRGGQMLAWCCEQVLEETADAMERVGRAVSPALTLLARVLIRLVVGAFSLLLTLTSVDAISAHLAPTPGAGVLVRAIGYIGLLLVLCPVWTRVVLPPRVYARATIGAYLLQVGALLCAEFLGPGADHDISSWLGTSLMLAWGFAPAWLVTWRRWWVPSRRERARGLWLKLRSLALYRLHLAGLHPAGVGSLSLPPPPPAGLELGEVFLHAYSLWGDPERGEVCRVRVYRSRGQSQRTPPLTVLLCSALTRICFFGRDRDLDGIAQTLWNEVGRPWPVVWLTQHQGSHPVTEFNCVQFRCASSGRLEQVYWANPVPRAEVEAFLGESIDPVPMDDQRLDGEWEEPCPPFDDLPG